MKNVNLKYNRFKTGRVASQALFPESSSGVGFLFRFRGLGAGSVPPPWSEGRASSKTNYFLGKTYDGEKKRECRDDFFHFCHSSRLNRSRIYQSSPHRVINVSLNRRFRVSLGFRAATELFNVFRKSCKKKRCFSVRPQPLCFVEGHLRASTALIFFLCNASRTKRLSTRLISVDGGLFRTPAARDVFFAAFLGTNDRIFNKCMKTHSFCQ